MIRINLKPLKRGKNLRQFSFEKKELKANYFIKTFNVS